MNSKTGTKSWEWGEDSASRGRTLGKEAADCLVGVHAALAQCGVDLRLRAVHDLLQALHQLPRPGWDGRRRPLPSGSAAAHPRRRDSLLGLGNRDARARRCFRGRVVVVIASVSAWFTLLPPTQRRPLPSSKTLPPHPRRGEVYIAG